MEKAITLGDKTIVLNNRFMWAEIYRTQFGEDVASLYGRIASALVDIFMPIVKEHGLTGLTAEAFRAVDATDVQMAILEITSGVGQTDLARITWAMARAADKNVPAYDIWAEELDDFYVDDVVPTLFELIKSSSISSKNLSSLRRAEATQE